MNANLLALGLFATLGIAGPARAQSVHLSYGKQTQRGGFSLSLSAPLAGACAPARVWVPGHVREEQRRVWVEGTEHRQWVPPAYATRFDECGRPYSVLAREGYWSTVRDPGHFELRTVSVWVDGYWTTAPGLGAPRGRFDGYRYDGRHR